MNSIGILYEFISIATDYSRINPFFFTIVVRLLVSYRSIGERYPNLDCLLSYH